MSDQKPTRIVAIPGFLGQPKDWNALKKIFRDKYPHIEFEALDLFSAKHPKTEGSLEGWAKIFNEAQKSKHLERNILVGYSLGGRLALHAVYDRPGMWDDVLLVSTHPGLENDEDKKARLANDKVWADKFLHMKWKEVIKEWNAQPVFVGTHEPNRTESQFTRSTLAAALTNWSLGNQQFEPELMQQLGGRLHWFVGANDPKFIKLYDELFAKKIISEINVVPDAGHRVLFDNPQGLFAQLVSRMNL